MKKNQLVIAAVALVVVVIVALILVNRSKKGTVAKQDDECAVQTSEMKMPDGYMRGRVDQDAAIEVQRNYYACNPLQRGDLVMFHISTELPPVIKEVVGVEGDTFRLEKSKDDDGWNIFINDRPYIGSTGKPYYLGNSKREPVLYGHQKATEGKIGAGQAIILSHVPRGNSDSGTFGLVEKKNIIAKVVPKK